jgi:protein arginine kinase activator
MKCEKCQLNDATVFIKQVDDGELREQHLCAGCALQNEGASDLAMPVLSELLFGPAAAPAPRAAKEKTCRSCGIKQDDFKKNSLLGCSECYDVFEKEVGEYLEAMQKGTLHVGKVPAREKVKAELARLHRELEQAVQAENFEAAAEIRDRIHTLKHPPAAPRAPKGGQGGGAC